MDFWFDVRQPGGRTIAEEFRDQPLHEQPAQAARPFELWRSGRLTIDYERNELCRRSYPGLQTRTAIDPTPADP